jgi:cytochrome c6
MALLLLKDEVNLAVAGGAKPMQIQRSISQENRLKPLFTVKLAILTLIMLVGLSLSFSLPVAASEADTAQIESQTGAPIFEVHCAGCHIHGGNIVRRNKTLKLKALEKNQMASLEAITNIVTNGKGNMSAYQDRLTAAEIQAVATYVLHQAEAGWQ